VSLRSCCTSARYLALGLFLVVILAISAGYFYVQSFSSDITSLDLDIVYPGITDAQDQELNTITAKFRDEKVVTTSPKSVASRYDVPFAILMYHHLNSSPKPREVKLTVTPENLERQISFLLSRGYHFVTLNQAIDDFIRDGHALQKTVVLTFDDGYRSFYTVAYPLLKKYHIPASVFVINQDIGKRGNLTWAMMKEMIKSGLVEVGVHTVNHKPLGKLSEEKARYQIAESKRLLEEGLGIPMTTIVYPFGNFNSTTKHLAKELGFKGAASVYFGQKPTAKDLFSWRRVQIQNKDQGEGLLRLLYAAFVVVK
jgi:peptidoglycan/xylan/chitin deacetylase (PgdA/CDA1 family)